MAGMGVSLGFHSIEANFQFNTNLSASYYKKKLTLGSWK